MPNPKFITCRLSAEDANYRPPEFPGSEEAFEKGCTCPQLQPWPGALKFSTDCPIHGLVLVEKNN